MSEAPPTLLDDLVVVELATGLAGPYAGKLFADAGADVTKVEPADGDEERRRDLGRLKLEGRDAALFQYLNAGKRSVVGSADDPRVRSLLAAADLVIVGGRGELDVGRARAAWPSLVVLTLTPFGTAGPWRDRPATDFTLQAESGSLGYRGRRDRPPVQAGGRLSGWAGGVCGAVGALAAVQRASRTGTGEHVDLALLAVDHLITNGNVCVRDSFLGHPHHDAPARMTDVPSIEPTADGFIGFNTNTRGQLESFLAMVGRTDLLDVNPRWASAEYRLLHAEEWNRAVRPWLRERTTAEVVRLAAAARIPTAPVNDGAALLHQEQFASRGVIAPIPGTDVLAPLPPYLVDGVRPRPRGPAPALGSGQVPSIPAPSRPPSVSTEQALPFAGLRVLDATSMWAGPTVGVVLAALGAEVVHLESVQRLDLARLKVDGASELPEWWERGHTWSMVNWNKRDVTLDLGSPVGRQLFARLVVEADVLVENYSPRVFDRFGFTGEQVRALNPEIVYARMPAFGLDGPWRDYVGFAQTMEQMSGLAWLTGHVEDETPLVPRGPCDPLAGYHALFAILTGLHRRSRGGGGCLIEATMAEAALAAAAELLVDVSAYGVELGRTGNRSLDVAPQGLYACRGEERWLAVSVPGDVEWEALRAALGSPPWAADPSLATVAGRREAHDSLDAGIAAWAAEREVEAAACQLLDAGVPAAVLRDPRLADQHPQLRACGYLEPVDHPVVGRHHLPTVPFRFAGVDRWVRSPAPRLGEHNVAVLQGTLGLSDDELTGLWADDVIGREPLAGNPSFDL